jgi:nucleotide-binding universal stress UspA family protein
MYQHALVPVDCSEDARHAALDIVSYLDAMTYCQVTLVATISKSPDAEIRDKKVKHAQEALEGLHGFLHNNYGVFTRCRILETSDPAAAIAKAATQSETPCDVIVMSTYQTRTEFDDSPCQGSLVDRVSQRATIPVVVLPNRNRAFIK